MVKFLAPTAKEYEISNAWGILTSIDIHGCNPSKIKDAEAIKEFTKSLCNQIEVKMYGDTQLVMFGDDPRVHGYSMVQLIETSLVSAHFAEESDSVYLDVFSCKYYNAEKAAQYSMEFFEGKNFNAHCILRGCPDNLPQDFLHSISNRNIILQERMGR